MNSGYLFDLQTSIGTIRSASLVPCRQAIDTFILLFFVCTNKVQGCLLISPFMFENRTLGIQFLQPLFPDTSRIPGSMKNGVKFLLFSLVSLLPKSTICQRRTVRRKLNSVLPSLLSIITFDNFTLTWFFAYFQLP